LTKPYAERTTSGRKRLLAWLMSTGITKRSGKQATNHRKSRPAGRLRRTCLTHEAMPAMAPTRTIIGNGSTPSGVFQM